MTMQPRKLLAGSVSDRLYEISEELWARINAGEFQGRRDFARVLGKLDALCEKGQKLCNDLKETEQGDKDLAP